MDKVSVDHIVEDNETVPPLRRPATLEELPASRLILLFTDENKYMMK